MTTMKQIIELYRKIALITVIGLVGINCSYLSFADTIVMKDGGEIRGQIIEDTDEEIKLQLKFDVMFIKKEDIEAIKKEKITEDLILTEDGVKDQWGSPIPPFPFDVNMMCSQFENFGPEQKAVHCKRYFSLAKEYEDKAKPESIFELRQGGLMTALVYYRIASNSPEEKIKKTSQSGAERCSAQLFKPSKEEIVIPFGQSMAEHIRFFIEKLNNEKEKGKYADIYFEMGRDYEAKSNVKGSSSAERLKNIQIAINCYYIVEEYSSVEKTRLIASKALSELQAKFQGYAQP